MKTSVTVLEIMHVLIISLTTGQKQGKSITSIYKKVCKAKL